MAESSSEFEKNEKKLGDVFLEGWHIYEQLEETSLNPNSVEFQKKVKAGMEHFENVTKIVSRIGMFSSNELLDEVSTESLQYLLLPFFLGKLALKIQQQDRLEVLNVAEIYFKDHLQRCQEYELYDAPKKEKNHEENSNASEMEPNNSNEMANLLRAANARNEKIAQFRRKKELEEFIKKMTVAVRSQSVDEEIRRDFFIKFLKKSIIETNEELESLQMEKQLVEMRKMHMNSAANAELIDDAPPNTQRHGNAHGLGHGHSHGGQHTHLNQYQPPKRKTLQPFIITRNATQKAVFGLGYPSLPVMTVDEFYQQRVDEGIFPDEEKVAKMNQAQAIAAVADPEIKEEEEKAAEEEQIENDAPEYLDRMRRLDEYKDVVRRGDGNRHNRS